MQHYKVVEEGSERFGQIGKLVDSGTMPTSNPPLGYYTLEFKDGEKLTFLAYKIEAVKPRKVLFLDIDGVCNSADFMKSNRNPNIGGALGMDPFAVVLVKMIIQDTECEVVLSSTWRLNKWSRDQVRSEVVDFIDVTPDKWRLPRGAEIQEWLDNNPDVTKYAILDDDSDMLAMQKPNFFKTTWEKGITREIAQAVTEHLNGN